MSAPYEHQRTGAHWLIARPRGYLGDVPGLGKTQTALLALAGSDATTALVVTPAIVRTHWQREHAETGCGVRIIVKSYDEIVRGGYPLMKELLVNEGVDTLITDEHHYLKHATSERARLLLGRDGYARRLERVWMLSGTPMPRNPLEFWTTMGSMFPEIALEYGLRTQADWQERFCVTRPRRVRGTWTQKVIGAKNVDELREILDRIMLRRTLDDVGLDVPSLDFQVLRLENSSADPKALAAGMAVIDYAIDDGHLAEIADDPEVARMRRRLGELKVAPVAEMLRSQLADSDEKIVVFAYHRSVLTALRELLRNFGVAYIDGDVGQPARDAEIERFQKDSRCRVFLGQNIACSTGMDGLQHVARRAIIVEPEWSGDVNLQLGKRIARLGSLERSRCVVQMIALAGTLDEAIVAQNARETRMVRDIVR